MSEKCLSVAQISAIADAVPMWKISENPMAIPQAIHDALPELVSAQLPEVDEMVEILEDTLDTLASRKAYEYSDSYGDQISEDGWNRLKKATEIARGVKELVHLLEDNDTSAAMAGRIKELETQNKAFQEQYERDADRIKELDKFNLGLGMESHRQQKTIRTLTERVKFLEKTTKGSKIVDMETQLEFEQARHGDQCETIRTLTAQLAEAVKCIKDSPTMTGDYNSDWTSWAYSVIAKQEASHD